MLTYVRTTIVIDDHLGREAKRLAAKRGITLSALVGQALRAALAAPAPPAQPFEMVTFGDGSPKTHHEPTDFAATQEQDDLHSLEE